MQSLKSSNFQKQSYFFKAINREKRKKSIRSLWKQVLRFRRDLIRIELFGPVKYFDFGFFIEKINF